MMELIQTRLYQNDLCTLGTLRCEEMLLCTLEDPYQEDKIPGKTRIDPGVYELSLRMGSPMAQRYRQRFGDQHVGMIWLQDVPRFQWVYLHIGNYPKDTDGCILVGNSFSPAQSMVGDSTTAYYSLFRRVIPHLQTGGRARLRIQESYQ